MITRQDSAKIPPKKGLGQFFLRDRNAALAIANSVSQGLPVVEIGPGDGALTWALLETGRQVTAIELDQDMVAQLSQRFAKRRDFRVIKGDILEIDWESIANQYPSVAIAGNLPYHLTAPILFSVFGMVRNKQKPLIKEMVVMIQKEVGQRLTAKTKTKSYGSLTLLAQYHADVEYLFEVHRSQFYPRPNVDGGVIKVTFREQGQIPDVEYDDFRRVVRGSFAQRRKMMRNSLGVVNDLPENWRDVPIDLTRRPEEFSFDEYIEITKFLFPKRTDGE